jgi:ABC-type nickel/cobalt efflux system permease component RcnA
VLFVFVALCATKSVAFAHPLGNFTINHLTRIAIGADRATLHYVVDYAEIPAFAASRAVDASGTMTERERATWATAQAARLAEKLVLDVDGTRVPLRPTAAAAIPRPGSGGLSTLYLTVTYTAPLAAGAHAITYVDTAFPNRIGWRDVVIGNEHEPTNMLRSYPNALIGSPRGITTAALSVGANGVATRSNAPVVAAVPVDTQGGVSLDRSNQLGDMLASNDTSIGFFLALFGVAIFLGALHALEPGHGKTLMAVSLVGARATIPQAAMLASAITVAHTAGVLALGAVILFAASWIVPEQIYPWITLGSGVVVAILGARSLNRFVQARRPQLHAHPHAHPAAQEHVHEHVHGIGTHEHHASHDHAHDAPVAFDPAAAARTAFAKHGHDHATMTDEEHARAHAIPGTDAIGFKSVIGAAMTGGIAPCPAALVVLLTAVNLHKIALGLALIVVFSFGLAAVLVGIGIAVVRGTVFLTRSSRFAIFTRYGPLCSATIIAIIGSVMIGEGLVAQGVGTTPVVFAILAMLAIAGYAFSAHTHTHRSPQVTA